MRFWLGCEDWRMDASIIFRRCAPKRLASWTLSWQRLAPVATPGVGRSVPGYSRQCDTLARSRACRRRWSGPCWPSSSAIHGPSPCPTSCRRCRPCSREPSRCTCLQRRRPHHALFNCRPAWDDAGGLRVRSHPMRCGAVRCRVARGTATHPLWIVPVFASPTQRCERLLRLFVCPGVRKSWMLFIFHFFCPSRFGITKFVNATLATTCWNTEMIFDIAGWG